MSFHRCAVRGSDTVDVAGSAEPLQADADARDLAECRSANPGARCEILERFCSE